MSRLATALLLASCWFATGLAESSQAPAGSASQLYQRTEYQSSLNVLIPLTKKSPGDLQLMGQDSFMLGDYGKATDEFDQALVLLQTSHQPVDAELYVWLGRAYGRRAETGNRLSALGYAARTRKYFEMAVQTDILNKEATGDLFDYYMGAPGFLGGGVNKAQELARKVAASDPAEGQHLLALLSEKSKEYAVAEQHLRSAIQLAPKQASRVMELARFLAHRGRAQESDTLFDQAVRMAPENHSILFYRAETYIEGNRNLSDARSLLESYLNAPLTPDDPSRKRAQELLAKTR